MKKFCVNVTDGAEARLQTRSCKEKKRKTWAARERHMCRAGRRPLHARARRLVFGLALVAGMVSAATAAQAQLLAVRMIGVLDGDTMVISTAESLNLKVRMRGVCALECGMPFGLHTQRFLEQLVLGRAASNLKCNTPLRVRCTDADQNDLPPASA